MSITAALSEHARRNPEGTALVCEGSRTTWRELDAGVGRLAGEVARRVPDRERGVALLLPNGPAFALFFLAAARAGREAQVLDPDWPDSTLASVLAELRPGLVVCGPGRPGNMVLPDPHASMQDLVHGLDLDTAPVPLAEPDERTAFYVGFTSGSTGLPKGFRRDHRSWLMSLRLDRLEFGLSPADVAVAAGPLTHSLSLYALVAGLNAGATVLLARSFRPAALLRAMAAEGASVLYAVPAQIGLLLAAAEEGGSPPLPDMRWVLVSGDRWSGADLEALARLFPSARFAEFYGASELSYVTLAKAGESVPPGSVGRPFAGVEVSIRDETGRRLPPGGVGEVFVASPLVFMGYAMGGSPLARHADAISVRDVGYLDEGGFLHLVGRAARMIIVSGRNVHPEEIEAALAGIDGIEAAAVFGVADARRGEQLVALLRCEPDAPLRRAELIAQLRERLPLYKVPRRFLRASAWPRTASGKSDFSALHVLLDAGTTEEIA
jgi:long-chain acyl-CoA synthetase